MGSLTVTHPYVSAVADSGDTTLVQPSDWNDDHTIVGSSDATAGYALVSQGASVAPAWEPIREQLTANRTYYVRTDGSDSNTGLANTAAGAWLTIQHGLDVIGGTLDFANYTVTLQVGAGTYNEDVTIPICVGQDPYVNAALTSGLIILGDEATPANCVVDGVSAQAVFLIPVRAGCRISGFKITGPNRGIWSSGGFASLGFMEYGTAGNTQITSDSADSFIYLTSDYTISGGAPQHLFAFGGGRIAAYEAGTVVTLTGTPNFTDAFVKAQNCGTIDVAGYGDYSFSGSATGKRFEVANDGAILTYGAGVDYFPGNSAGTLESAGTYDSLIGGVREQLTANRTYYVRTDGSDSNTGLVNTAAGAFLTIQHAYDVITSTIDLSGYDIVIQVGDGTYTGGLAITEPWTGGGTITLRGNTGAMSSVILDVSGKCVENLAVLPGHLLLEYLKLESTSNCIANSGLGIIKFKNINFSTAVGSHIIVNNPGAFVWAYGDYTISGGSGNHVQTNSLGAWYLDGYSVGAVTVTLTSTPAFSQSFAECFELADSYWSGNTTFSGSATGKRFIVEKNGSINTENSGLTFLPGDASGTIDTGGIYDGYTEYSIPLTLASLSTSPVTGMLRSITDSSAVTWGTAITAGGSSNAVAVRYNGTNWTVFAI